MSFFKPLLTVSGYTLLSRILGYVRDKLMADLIGAGPVMDAFVVAFMLPNLFRRLFAEGALNAAFVPQVTHLQTTQGMEEALRFTRQVFSLLFWVILALVVVIEIFMPAVIHLQARGFDVSGERYAMAVVFGRIMFPYILFVALMALMASLLNSLHRFASATAAPIILNILAIAALIAADIFALRVGPTLAWSILVAGICQCGWLWFSTWRLGLPLYLVRHIWNADIKHLLKRMVPGAIGAGVVQINLSLGIFIASFQGVGANSYLFYADRINQLPLSMIGIAMGTVLLPLLSRQLKAHDWKDALQTQNRAIELALFLTAPAAVGLFILSHPIIQVLFEGGKFTPEDAVATGHTLAAFVLGLPAYVLIKILSANFFARSDTKTPVILATFSSMAYLVSVFSLTPFLSYVGIAASLSLSAWMNVGLLGWRLRHVLTLDARLLRFLPRLLSATAVMGGLVLVGKYILHGWFASSLFISHFLALFSLIGVGFVGFLVAGWCVGAYDKTSHQAFFKIGTS